MLDNPTEAKFPTVLEKACSYNERQAFNMEFKIIQTNFRNNVGDNSVVKNCLQNHKHSAEQGKGGYMTQGATNGVGTIP